MFIELRLYVRRNFRIAGAAGAVSRASRKSAGQDQAASERMKCWFVNTHCRVSFCCLGVERRGPSMARKGFASISPPAPYIAAVICTGFCERSPRGLVEKPRAMLRLVDP